MSLLIFFVPIFLSVTILSALAVYVTFQARNHPLKFIFLALILCQTFIQFLLFHRYIAPGTSTFSALPMMLQWAAGAWIPALFLHLGSFFLMDPLKEWVRRFLPIAYIFSLASMIIVLNNEAFFSSTSIRELGTLRLIGHQLTPLGKVLAYVGQSQIVGGFLLLAYTSRKSPHPAGRLRARWMCTALAFYLSYGALNLVAISFAHRPLPWGMLAASLASLSYLAIALMGITAGYSILRYGLPVAEPMSLPDLLSTLVWLPLIILLSWVTFQFDRAVLSKPFGDWMLPPLLAGLLFGAALLRPRRGFQRILMKLLPTQSMGSLQEAIEQAWSKVASRQADENTAVGLLRLLVEETGASFLLHARRVEAAEKGEQRFAIEWSYPEFGELEWMRSSIQLKTRRSNRPLVSASPLDDRYPQLQELFPVSLREHTAVAYPIILQDRQDGLILVGHPCHGGAFSSQAIDAILECITAVGAVWTSQWLNEEQERLSTRARWLISSDALFSQVKPREDTKVQIFTLGRFQVFAHGSTLKDHPLITRKALSLLAYLVWSSFEGASSEVLQAALWPDIPSAKARNLFNVNIHHLRRVLEPTLDTPRLSQYIIRSRNVYTFIHRKDVWIDADAFHTFLNQGLAHHSAGECQAAVELLQQALSLYQGDYLNDPGLDLPLELESTRQELRDGLSRACWSLADIAEREGEEDLYESALTTLTQHLPWDVRGLGSLVEFHTRRGDTARAKHYRDRQQACRFDLGPARE